MGQQQRQPHRLSTSNVSILVHNTTHKTNFQNHKHNRINDSILNHNHNKQKLLVAVVDSNATTKQTQSHVRRPTNNNNNKYVLAVADQTKSSAHRVKKTNSSTANNGQKSISTIGPSATTTTTTMVAQQQHQQPVAAGAQNAQTPITTATSISKQHLAARVKSIIGKLTSSHGPELRRTLFSLRQTFHDDHELAGAFIEMDGFECLMKAAQDADQIHQNYILRAIGQLIASSNGMSGLTRHNQTIQWLYTLIASQHRLVVKTSIKLLLTFVEHSDNNCLLFCRAIKTVDGSKGANLWSNVLTLFAGCGENERTPHRATATQNDYIAVLVDAVTLVNKTLAGIPDQDTYYDLVEPLEAANMEAIANKYSQLDPQLKEQFKIYEQALRAEDENSEQAHIGQVNSQDPNSNARLDRNQQRKQQRRNNPSAFEMDATTQSPQSNPIATTTITKLDHKSSTNLISSNSNSNHTTTNSIIAANSDAKHALHDDECDGVKSDAAAKQSRLSKQINTSSSVSTTSAHMPAASNVEQQSMNDTDSRRKLLPPLAKGSSRVEQQVAAAEVESECTNDDNYESANDDEVVRDTSVASVLTSRNSQHQREQKSSTSDSDDDPNGFNTSAMSKPKSNNAQGKTVHFSADSNSCSSSGSSRHKQTLRDATLQEQHEKVSASSTNKPDQVKQNLSRGKQQRASISSCSSSDSYASYGSGYASGSSNSTDHEQKHNIASATIVDADKGSDSKSGPSSIDESINFSASTMLNNARAAPTGSPDSVIKYGRNSKDEEFESVSGVVEGDVYEDEDDEERSQKLRRDLNELEQLTDELANRKLSSTSKRANINSDSHTSDKYKMATSETGSLSNSSSILSTDSNISFNSATSSATDSRQCTNNNADSYPEIDYIVGKTAKVAIDEQAESRSTSTTPTLAVQQKNTSQSVLSSSICKKQTSTSETNGVVYQAKLVRPLQQHQTGQTAANNHNLDSQSQSSSKLNPKLNNPSGTKQEPYYHNLFHWEQLLSKGVTRPLLINDLDFTDLRDEDDCDLLNSISNQPNSSGNIVKARVQASGEPLTINIPSAQQHIQGKLSNDQDSADSGASTGSPAGNSNLGTPASAPPPLPPPPISPWFNTISGSRPQSQFMSSPSPPPYDFGNGAGQRPLLQPSSNGDFVRDQSPANSTYSSCSRNSVCVSQMNAGNVCSPLQNNFKTLQSGSNLRSASSMSSLLFGNNGKYANKRKKTMKLFWKEVREDRSLLSKLTRKKTIWDEVKPAPIDTTRLEYLFESKAKDLLSKSRNGLDGINQRKVKITVLDAKRSNAINIGMTKLPPMRTIKSAILKMDSSIMNREGIEKILTTMMPSEEEKSRIIEAQLANPDTPLGTAEQFLLNLASISALEARLKLWAFQLDYTQIEKEVAEPLMDLKQAIEEIEGSETFRIILGTLLAIGNFLNSTNVKGFQIDYLEKVPEVKDTVHKHSLLHHLCLFIQEKYDPQTTTDLYSEFSAVNRASKVDYAEVAKNLKKMQQDCKASWDYLKIVAKHDGLANLMNACGSSVNSSTSETQSNNPPTSSGKLNNLGKLSMITSMITSENTSSAEHQTQQPSSKQLKTKVSDFLTDCAERIMVLMVIHRRVMNRFQKLLVYLGCPSHQIKQTQPQQILKIINEFALEYRTKRERVREMLMKRQQCHHYNHRHEGTNGPCENKWQLNRNRWAGSQQCIDSLSSGFQQFNRPCSTASLYANSNPLNCCRDSICNLAQACRLSGDRRSLEPNHMGVTGPNRPGSPSGMSQISNFSDYLFDRSCCNSRQDSITPVPFGNIRRPQSMSVSMFDLQNQKLQGANSNNNDANATNQLLRDESTREKDEQLRRLLGAGRSFDGTCNDLYQMSHWNSTINRVTRHPVTPGSNSKLRSSSIDASLIQNNSIDGDDMNTSDSNKHQSSYYKHLHNGNRCQNEDIEQNSDDEILQCLVRAATAKSSNSGANRCRGLSANKVNVSNTNAMSKKLIESKAGLR